MIHIKRFVIERVVDFIMILEVHFPRNCYQNCFHELCPVFSYDITVDYKREEK